MMLSNEILTVDLKTKRFEIHKDAFDNTWYLISYDLNERCKVVGHEINLIQILKYAENEFHIPSNRWNGTCSEFKKIRKEELATSRMK